MNILLTSTVDGLLRVSREGDIETLRMLLESDPAGIVSRDYDGVTPLHIGAHFGYLEVVKLLLTKGADVNAQTVDGSTPLCDACAAGHKDIAELLLQHGASPNPILLPLSPLHDAAVNGSLECCKLLLRYNARVDPMESNYGTPLQAAVCRGHYIVAKFLLNSGAKVDSVKIHSTALHYAAEAGNEPMARLLLSFGACVYYTDNRGRRPSQVAKQEHLVSLLKKAEEMLDILGYNKPIGIDVYDV